MKKQNKIREARLNKIRSRKNNIRKEKVRLKKIEEAKEFKIKIIEEKDWYKLVNI